MNLRGTFTVISTKSKANLKMISKNSLAKLWKSMQKSSSKTKTYCLDLKKF